MAKITGNENWVNPNSIEDEDEDQEEALSLCDLPTNEEEEEQSRTESAQPQIIQIQEDFDFGSWSSSSLLTHPEMCAADDVFFQGQIRPLRHSISSASDSGLAKFRQDSSGNMNGRFISRSMSMDHHHCSAGGFSSSRSSSISSGSASTTNYKPKIRNQFHSHPSPNPQIRFPIKNPTHIPNRKSSTMWRFFQVGLLKTPEIELKDLKIRSKNNTIHPFGSRNSSSSISTSTSSIANQEHNKIGKKKKKIHGGLFRISCKCSVDAIETVPLNLVIVKNVNGEKEELLGKKKKMKKKNQGKQAMSRHRTFEWLKQLSLQEGGGGGGGGGGDSNSDHVSL